MVDRLKLNLTQLNTLRLQTLTLFTYGMKNRYRNTIAGVFWVLFQPLFQFGIQAFAFIYILRVDSPNYSIYLLTGILPWIFLVSTVEMTVGSLINNSLVFKAITVNPAAFVVSQAMDNFVVFNLGLITAALLLSAFIDVKLLGLLGMVPAGIFLFSFGTSLALIFAVTQVFFRDFRYLLTFAFSALYFATPIIYPLSFVDEAYRQVFRWNPIFIMIQPFRESFLGNGTEYLVSLGHASLVAGISVFAAVWIWKKAKNSVVLHV